MTILLIGIGLALAVVVVGAVFLLNRNKAGTDKTSSDGDIAFGDSGNTAQGGGNEASDAGGGGDGGGGGGDSGGGGD